jgi:hypothetical protein
VGSAGSVNNSWGVRGQSTILDTLEEKAKGSLREPSGCMRGWTPHPRMADPFAPHKELTTPRRLEDTKQLRIFLPLCLRGREKRGGRSVHACRASPFSASQAPAPGKAKGARDEESTF